MRANLVGIARVSGPIVDLLVVDNQRVAEGDVLFVVDPRPYEATLAEAEADLALIDRSRRCEPMCERRTGWSRPLVPWWTSEAEAEYARIYLAQVRPLLAERSSRRTRSTRRGRMPGLFEAAVATALADLARQAVGRRRSPNWGIWASIRRGPAADAALDAADASSDAKRPMAVCRGCTTTWCRPERDPTTLGDSQARVDRPTLSGALPGAVPGGRLRDQPEPRGGEYANEGRRLHSRGLLDLVRDSQLQGDLHASRAEIRSRSTSPSD